MDKSKAITTGIILIIALGMSMLVMVEVIGGGGNSLANFGKYLALGSFFVGVVNGRVGVYWLIFLFAYGDFLKRLLVYYGRIDMLDVTYILAAAPLTGAGITVHFFLGLITGKLDQNPRNWKLFWIAFILTGVSAVFIVLRGGVDLGMLKSLAHFSSYFMLIWVFYVAARTRTEVRVLLEFTMVVFIPVALYGIFQGIFGLNDFELAYLDTGLSIEAKYLSEGVTHAFSTMSSAKGFGITMVFCLAILIFLKRERTLGSFVFVLLAVICVFACYFCMKRSAWLVMIAFFIGLNCFGSKFKTIGLYGATSLGIVLLLAFADSLLQEWSAINAFVSDILPMDSDRTTQAFQISTFSARLVGFRNLMSNPDMWSIFGVDRLTQDAAQATGMGTGLNIDRVSSMLTHDALTGAVLNFGVVPTVLVGLIGLRALVWFHSMPHRFHRKSELKRLFVVLLAIIFAGLSVGITDSTYPFPINAFLFMFIAFLIRINDINMSEISKKKNDSEPNVSAMKSSSAQSRETR